jgi:hypothetical protein
MFCLPWPASSLPASLLPTAAIGVLVVAFGVLPMAPARAQSSQDLLGGARASGLGHATTALPGDAGGHVNPALRARHSWPVASLVARQSFGLAELRFGSAHVAIPLRLRPVDGQPNNGQAGTVVSGGASTFGFADYREVHLNAGAARGFSLGTSRTVFAGLHLRYHHTRISSYGSAGGLALNAGLAVDVVETFVFGAHATNLLGASLHSDASLPQTLAVGVGYEASDRVHLVVDAVKDLDFPLSVRGGLEVWPVSVFALRTGVTTNPTRFTTGTGVRLGPLSADLAAERHSELGWSPTVGMDVRW